MALEDKKETQAEVNPLTALAGDYPGIEIPPPVFKDMAGEIKQYDQGKAITIRFPVKKRYSNPVGMMQGGMIVAALDNTFGPLSYLVAPPSVTTHLNTTFIRPVTPGTPYIYVTARLLEKTSNHLFMTARVTDGGEKLFGVSYATCKIVTAQGE